MQLILTLIFYVWLFGTLALLWLIWRESTRRTGSIQQSLVEINMKSAEAAHLAAEAAKELAAHLEKKRA